MKKMLYLAAVVALCFGFGAARVQAQTEAQVLTFSIICQYVTNVYATNVAAGVTNDDQIVTTVLLNSANIAKAIAIDLEGTNWAKYWDPALIVREVNLSNGHEGIFLRSSVNTQTNISNSTNFFAFCFTNEFTCQVTNVFTTTYYNTNLPIKGGWSYTYSNTNKDTNIYTVVDGLHYVSFTSSNLQFNIFGSGQGTEAEAGGHLDGKLYELPTVSTEITGAGTFNLNVATNVFFNPNITNPPAYYTGLAHGTVIVGAPYFLAIPPPP